MNNKIIKLSTICAMVAVMAIGAQSVFSQGLKDANNNLNFVGSKAGANTAADLPTLVGGIISAALTLVGIIFLILMVYAGYLWMTAAGEEAQVEKAQNIIKASIIGIVVVLSAYAITTFVTSRLSAF